MKRTRNIHTSFKVLSIKELRPSGNYTIDERRDEKRQPTSQNRINRNWVIWTNVDILVSV